MALTTTSTPRLWQAYFNNHVLTIFVLGMASGLPLALSTSTLQAWFTVGGLNYLAIGLVTLVGLPYVWKMLWAPLLDYYRLPLLDHRRGWILALQSLVALDLAGMSQCDLHTQLTLLSTLAVALAFFSASLDIVINAYQTELLQTQERGIGAAYYMGGYRIALLISGGLALIIADHWGWQITYMSMSILMIILMPVTYFAPALANPTNVTTSLWAASKLPIINFFQRNNAIAILAFIASYKVGEAFTLSFISTFMLRGLHFSLTEVGVLNKVVALIGALLGMAVAGGLMTRLSLRRALLYFGILQACSNLSFALLALVGKNFYLAGFCIGFEYFCSGMATAALLALLMSLCDQRYTATQFALLSAVAALGRVLIGPIAGMLLSTLSWTQFYCLGFLISLPTLWLLRKLGNEPLH